MHHDSFPQPQAFPVGTRCSRSHTFEEEKEAGFHSFSNTRLICPLKSWHHPHVQFLEASRASWQLVPPKTRPHSCQPAACGGSVACLPLPQPAAVRHAAVAHSLQYPVPHLISQSLPPHSRMHEQWGVLGLAECLLVHPTLTKLSFKTRTR